MITLLVSQERAGSPPRVWRLGAELQAPSAERHVLAERWDEKLLRPRLLPACRPSPSEMYSCAPDALDHTARR